MSQVNDVKTPAVAQIDPLESHRGLDGFDLAFWNVQPNFVNLTLCCSFIGRCPARDRLVCGTMAGFAGPYDREAGP